MPGAVLDVSPKAFRALGFPTSKGKVAGHYTYKIGEKKQGKSFSCFFQLAGANMKKVFVFCWRPSF